MKNLHLKNLKRKSKYFPTSNFIFIICLSLQEQIEPHVFVPSILQFVWQDLAIAFKNFSSTKKYVLNFYVGI